MIAMLRTSSRCCIGPSYHGGSGRPPIEHVQCRLIYPPEARLMNRLLALMLTVLARARAIAQAKPAARSPTAVITVEKGGEITLEFFTADAPKHVANFLKLARAGFYDGQRFHRVEPGFVVQLGDPQSKTLPKIGRAHV